MRCAAHGKAGTWILSSLLSSAQPGGHVGVGKPRPKRPEYKSLPGGHPPTAELVGGDVNLGWEFKVSSHHGLPILSSPTPTRFPEGWPRVVTKLLTVTPVAVMGRPCLGWGRAQATSLGRQPRDHVGAVQPGALWPPHLALDWSPERGCGNHGLERHLQDSTRRSCVHRKSCWWWRGAHGT